MNKIELLGELSDQIAEHGEEVVVFWLETDDGGGYLTLTDIKFEDNQIKVLFA